MLVEKLGAIDARRGGRGVACCSAQRMGERRTRPDTRTAPPSCVTSESIDGNGQPLAVGRICDRGVKSGRARCVSSAEGCRERVIFVSAAFSPCCYRPEEGGRLTRANIFPHSEQGIRRRWASRGDSDCRRRRRRPPCGAPVSSPSDSASRDAPPRCSKDGIERIR